MLTKFIWIVAFLIAAILLGSTIPIATGLYLKAAMFLPVLPIILWSKLSLSGPDTESTAVSYFIAMFLFAFTLFPSYYLFDLGDFPPLNIRRIILIIMATMVGYRLNSPFLTQNTGIMSGLRAARRPLYLLLMYLAARVMASSLGGHVFAGLISSGNDFLNLAVPILFVVTYVTNEKLRTISIYLFVIFFGAEAILAVIERQEEFNIFATYMPSGDRFSLLRETMSVSRFRDEAFRAQGTTSHPLLLAQMACLCEAVSIGLILWSSRSGVSLSLGVGGLLASIIAIWSASSRSGILAGLIVLAVMVGLRVSTSTRGRTNVLARASIAILLSAIALAPIVISLAAGRTQQEAGSSGARSLMLQMGLPAIKAHILTGQGIGSAGQIAGVESFNNGVIGGGYLSLDNHLLAIAIETGLPTLLLYVSVFVSVVFCIIKNMSGINSVISPTQTAAIAIIAAFLSFELIMWLEINYTLIMFLVGLGLLPKSESLRPAGH